MAEALAKKILKDNFPDKCDRISISSAGVSAVDGLPASQGAIDILKSKGIDLREHRSQLVTVRMIERSDLILTMSQDQRERVKALSPTSSPKVFALKEFNLLRNGCPAEACDYDLDIADPGGGPREVFEACVAELEKELKAMLEKI
jgi:protein-tyrosine phosphatase